MISLRLSLESKHAAALLTVSYWHTGSRSVDISKSLVFPRIQNRMEAEIIYLKYKLMILKRIIDRANEGESYGGR